MKIVTAAEMREIDRITTEKFGVPSLTLMENAGAAVAEFILTEYPQAQRIGVICGKGNNGGDGFVCARKLHGAGKQVSVLLLADTADLKGDAAAVYQRLPVQAVFARNEEEFSRPEAQEVYAQDLLVDAILGTGFQPPVQGLFAAAIAAFRRFDTEVVSIDIPSACEADRFDPPPADQLSVPAQYVITFTAPRPAHVFGDLAKAFVAVAPIGSPEEAIQSQLNLHVIMPQDLRAFIARRPRASHKGAFGHVLVIGGSVGKAGAAAMAGMAALRAGAGLVTVACPRSVLPTVAGFAPELMTEPLDETDAGTISLRALEYGHLDRLLQGKSVVAIGPGLSRHPESAEFARTVIARCRLPAVVDADGLNSFEGRADQLRSSRGAMVLTPHPGEFARLTAAPPGSSDQARIDAARSLAQRSGAHVVLKGFRSVLAAPDGNAWVNPVGSPALAKGGSGDILTGLIAGIISQHPRTLAASVACALWLHGEAGEIAGDELGETTVVATDLLRFLPHARQQVRNWLWKPYVNITH